MLSTFFGLEIARRALDAQQMALDVTGQNISNASTPGYTRQIANLQATQPQEIGVLGHQVSVGTGVAVGSVTRARDKYLDGEYRSQTSIQQYWGEKESTLQNVQGMLSEPSNTGLNTDLSNFWNAWSDLSTDPQNAGARAVVKEQALTLTDDFHNMAQQISSLQSSQDSKVQDQIHQINDYATQIQQLNKQIKEAQAGGANPNDLMDQRDNIVDQLAQIANVTVTEKPDPTNSHVTDYSVAIGGTPSLTGASSIQNVTSASAPTSASVTGGTLKVTVGAASPPSSLSVNVSPSESLSAVAAAINLAASTSTPTVAVTASVAAVTGGYQLFLNNSPGTSGSMVLTDSSGLGVSTLNVPSQPPPQTLVSDNTVYTLKDPVTNPGSAGSPALPIWATGPYASMQVNLGNEMGSLSADISLRDTYLNNLSDQMNTLAQGVANAVNDLQRSGQGLSAETQTTASGAPVGIDFFTTSQASTDNYITPASLPSGITAANITLNQTISDNVNRIATGLLTEQAQKVASSVQNVVSATAPTTVSGGTFAITAAGTTKTVTVNPTDSLSTIAGSINSAAAGVTASVNQTGGGYQLVLTDSADGVDNTPVFTDTSGILASLGILGKGWQSNVQSGLSNAEAPTTLQGGTLTLAQGSGSPVNIAVSQNESLSDIAAAINATDAGFTAAVTKVGSGSYQLSINNPPGSTATLMVGDESGLGATTAPLQSSVQNVSGTSAATTLSGGTLTMSVGTTQTSIAVSQNESLSDIAAAINSAFPHSPSLATVQSATGGYQLVINPPNATTPLVVNSDSTGLGMAVQTAAATAAVATVVQPATDETVNPGDGSVAQSIASLAQGWTSLQNQINNGDFGPAGTDPVAAASFADYYSANVSQVGVDTQEATQMKSNQDALVSQVSNQRQSVSGVSLDEEMTKVIQYQQIYSAAARLVTSMDSMLSTLVTGMGITR